MCLNKDKKESYNNNHQSHASHEISHTTGCLQQPQLNKMAIGFNHMIALQCYALYDNFCSIDGMTAFGAGSQRINQLITISSPTAKRNHR